MHGAEWLTAGGITLYVVPLSIGGLFQGWALNNPNIPFLEVVEKTYLWLEWRTVSGVLMSLGHIAFVVLFIALVRRQFQPYQAPTITLASQAPPPSPA